jgi:hypothetical protein
MKADTLISRKDGSKNCVVLFGSFISVGLGQN